MASSAGEKASSLATMDRLTAATIAAMIAKAVVCILPIVPAVRVNLDGAAGQGAAWTTFAIGSVIAGAAFTELALEGKGIVRSTLFAILATFFVGLNVLNAIGNAASHSDVSRDAASSQQEKARRLAERRSQLSQGRAEMVAIAGSATPESLEADIRAAKAASSRLWNSSYQCDPSWTTRDATREFCASLAEFEKKKAAAVRRDQIDAQLAALDAKDVEAPPSAVESYVNNMARFLGALGYAMDDKAKELIASSRDWLKGVGVELLAAFGPAAMLALLARFGRHHALAPQVEPRARRRPEKATKGNAVATVAEGAAAALAKIENLAGIVETSQGDDDPEIDDFIGRRLESLQDAFVPAKALFEAWLADCAEQGIEAGSQKAFSKRLQRRVGYDRNNGRPRYCHVKLKLVTHAPLRLAVSNA
jgi:hypothetical protein